MRTASGLAMVILVLVLVIVGGAAVRLLMDRQAMATMIDEYGQTLSGIPAPPGAAAQAFTSARERAGVGDYAAAKSDLKRGIGLLEETAPPMARPGAPPGQAPTPAPSPEDLERAVNDLPEKARAFFRERPQLLRQVMMLRARAGDRVPPQEVEKHAKRITDAAAAGDEEAVKSILAELRGALGPAAPQAGQRRGSGMPGRGGRGAAEARGQVRQWITEARRILAQAKRSGVDTRKASELVSRAEQLLARGNEREAAEKMQEAMGTMRGMVPQGERRPGRMPRGGQRMARRPTGGAAPGIMPGVLGALLGQMRLESAAILGAMEDIENAGLALLEKNQGQIREMLSSATDKLKAVGKGRSELDKKLEQMQRAPLAAPGSGRPRGPRGGPGAGQERPGQARPPFAPAAALEPRRVYDLLGRALDEARTLAPEEYEEQREDMLTRIVEALMKPPDEQMTLTPGEPPRPVGPGLPPLELPDEEPTDPAEREELREQVRERMRMLHEPYLMLANVGVEMEPVEHLVHQARDAFTADELLDAGKAVNHASDLVWQLMRIHRAALEAAVEKGDDRRAPTTEEAPNAAENDARP